ncbi:MAG: hypothetical protein RL653_2238 [Pseudomonadota bacterium]|jgi:hypothetical protein
MTLPTARWFAAATTLLLLSACGPRPPTARPGEARTVAVGARVLLDGSQSGDEQRSPLSWAWALSKAPAGSVSVLEGAATPNPTFVADAAGEYVVTLVVSTGTLRSEPATVVVTATALPPVAHAVSQSARPGEVVVLDGSGSRGSGGAVLTYKWTVADPTGEPVALTAADTARPSFRPPRIGVYPVALVVNDGAQDSAPVQANVTVAEALRAPVAVVQPAATSAAVGNPVRLDAFGSYDPDGSGLTYAWTLVDKPAGSSAVLDAPAAAAVTLTPDVLGAFVVSLVVTDATGEQAVPALARITVENGAPRAVFVDPGSTWVDTEVLLDGSGSTDPDGDALDFLFNVAAGAPGSAQLLPGPRPGTSLFRASEPGRYGVVLRVSDGLGHEVSVLRTVEVRAATALTLLSGGGQSGTAYSTLGQPVVVEARHGTQPVPNARVAWRVHNGTLLTSQATTDAQGRAVAFVRTSRMVSTGTVTAWLEATAPAVEVRAPFSTLPGPVKLLTLNTPISPATAGGVLVSVRTTDEFGNPASEPAYAQLPIQLSLRNAVTAAFDTGVTGGVGVLQSGGGTFTVVGTLVDGKFDILVKETRSSTFQVSLELPAGNSVTTPLQLAAWYGPSVEDAEGGFGGSLSSAGSPAWNTPVLPQAEGRRAYRVEVQPAELLGNVATQLQVSAPSMAVKAARIRYLEQLQYAAAVDPARGCVARAAPRLVATCPGCAETEFEPLQAALEPAGCDGRRALPPTPGSGFAARTVDLTELFGGGGALMQFSVRSQPQPFLPAQPVSWALDDVRLEVLGVASGSSLVVTTAVVPGPATRVAFSQSEYGNVVFTDGYCGAGRPSSLTVVARLLDAAGNLGRTAEPVLLRFNAGQGLTVAGVVVGTLKGIPGTQQVDVEIPAQPSPTPSFGVSGDARAAVVMASPVALTNAVVSLADAGGSGLQLPPPVALTFQDLTCHNNGLNRYWADTTTQGTHDETQALRACEAEYGPGQCVAQGGRTFTTTAFSTLQVCPGRTRHQSRAWYFTNVNDPSCGGAVSGNFSSGELGTLGFDAATSCVCTGVASVPAPVTRTANFVVVSHSLFNWN